METYTLVTEKRDLSVKAKKIRESGFVPAVVYGHHLDAISIQIKQVLATKFFQSHSKGSKVLLTIDGVEQLAIFKELQRDPISRKVNHIDFQALTSGEKVSVTIPINYINKDSLEHGTVLQEQMSAIEISALPKFLIDHVEVDISKYTLGDSVFVKDLDIVNDENIEVLSSQESQLCTISQAAKFVEEVAEEVEEVEAEEVEPTEE